MKRYLKFEIKQMCNDNDKIKEYKDIEKFENKDFNKDKALSLYFISKAVSDWSGCKDPLPTPPKGFDLLKTFQCYDSYSDKYRNMVVVYKSNVENMLIVSFSGTKYLSEWVDDADFRQTSPESYNDNSILVHNGFYSMYKSMRDDFFKLLSENVIQGMQIISTGHSLGGCLAALCYVDILKNLSKLNFNDSIKIFLYTFASPRVGNIEFANFINANNNNNNSIAYRVINTEDIIPLAILPVISDYIYENYNNIIVFTLNLKDNGLNHGQAYLKFLSS